MVSGTHTIPISLGILMGGKVLSIMYEIDSLFHLISAFNSRPHFAAKKSGISTSSTDHPTQTGILHVFFFNKGSDSFSMKNYQKIDRCHVNGH